MRLTGWKSIANYLDVSVRTAQRWHREFRLPLERTPTGKPTGKKEALDRWVTRKKKPTASN